MEPALPTEAMWYTDDMARFVGGAVLLLLGTFAFQFVRRTAEEFASRRAKKREEEEAEMGKIKIDLDRLGAKLNAEVGYRTHIQGELNGIKERIEAHEAQLHQSDIVMAEMRALLQQTLSTSLEIRTMVTQTNEALMQHLINHPESR